MVKKSLSASRKVESGFSTAGQASSGTRSISNVDDTDYYSFTVSEPSLLAATLTPRGGVFTQASQGQTPTSFDANARNDLALTVFDTNGTSVLGTSSANPAGAVEALADLTLTGPGLYYARITGADDTIQLYELSLSVETLLPGDFNHDNTVDAADYVVWRKTIGTQAAYDLWRAHFGESAPGSGSSASASQNAVPEPAAAILLLSGLIAVRRTHRR